MSIYSSTVKIKKDIDEVWSYIINPTNASQWIYDSPKVEVITEGKIKEGTKYKLNYQDYFMIVEIKKMIVNQELVLEFIDGPATGSKRIYTLNQKPEFLELKSDLKIRLKGIWKTLYPIMVLKEYKDRQYSIGKIKMNVEK